MKTLTADTLEFGKSPTTKSPTQFTPFHIGDLDWSVEGDVLTLEFDGKAYEVADDGFRYVIQYGLQQALTDSYAAEIDAAKATTRFIARLKKIIEGTMSLDGKSTGDPVRAEMRALAVRAYCTSQGKSESALRKELGKTWSRTIRGVMEQLGDKLRPAAESIVEAKRLAVDLALTPEPAEPPTAQEQAPEQEQVPAPKKAKRAK